MWRLQEIFFSTSVLLFMRWDMCHVARADYFDDLAETLDSKPSENCKDYSVMLPKLFNEHAVYKVFTSSPYTPNRTRLIYAHNIVANRALFYSFVYTFLSNYKNFDKEPGLFYHYLSLASNTAAYNQEIKSSGLVFDYNCSYPNWRRDISFNKTLRVFTPMSWWRESNGIDGIINVSDLTTLPNVQDYTDHGKSRYRQWDLPDDGRSGTSHLANYFVRIKKSVRTGEFQNKEYQTTIFFGPVLPSKAVRLTRPYFDCGKTKEWVLTASSPVAEFMPRNTMYKYLRRYRTTAVVTADISTKHIDFNPCPASFGNEPHALAGIAKCKNTTECEPLSGFGFKRGGYICICKEGYRYPESQSGPFHGSKIEEATVEQYQEGFDCLPIEAPYQDSNDTGNVSDKQSATVSIVIDNERNQEMENIVDRVQNTATINCDNAKPSSLKLPRETAHGAAQVFEIQGRAALRLANFLSSFLQITYKSGSNGIPDFLKVDELLNEGQLFGEVMTNVLSDINMVGTGIFFDKNGFETKLDGNIVTREYFGPYAWQPEEPETVSVIDFAGFSDTYTDNAWFQKMKATWRTVDDLEEYVVDPVVNSESRGLESLPQHTYFAATYEDGEWLQPEFICNKDITINKWTVRFIVPFFGFNKQRSLEFKGIVAVDAPLQNMDINQCPADVMVSNAFKNTAKCDYNSTYCSPINGMMFQTGAYKCECRQGYHMPFNSTERYFDGQSVEEEYKKYKSGLPNRFASFKCDKIPGKDKTTTSQACPSIQISALVVTFALVVIFLTRN